MAEFIVPLHTDDLELKKPDRFCIQNVIDIENADTDEIIDGALLVTWYIYIGCRYSNHV